MISIILQILERYFGISITSSGYTGLLIFALLFGFAGAIINLQISRWMAKRAYKITLIDANSAMGERKLTMIYQTVQQIASQHSIKIPEIWYYHNATPNAFATWPSKNKSLIAVSTWLLENLNEKEVRAVIWHEMSHILNGDMVTMTLLQGVLNTFVIFFARVIAMAISNVGGDEGKSIGWMSYFLVVIVLDITLSILASIILMAYSRHREYQADAGSARMIGSKYDMIDALKKLWALHQDTKIKQDAFATLMIAGGKSWMNIFHSHPTMEKRIEALQNLPM